MTRKKVACIIVCWNNEDLLKECFDSLAKQTYKDYRVIMVDNGSKDNSIETAKAHPLGVEVVEAGENLGFAKGNNVGITHALKDPEVGYVALVNTDATLSPDWIEQLVKFCQNKPKAACVQGTTLDYYNHKIIDSTHIYVSLNTQATQGNWREYYQMELGPRKIFGVNAAACVITRNFIEAQPFGDEFFDETMFMYLEDVDVAARATVMGWDNYLVPTARAYHMGSASSGKNPGWSLYMTFRNNNGMLIKNFPWYLIFRMLPYQISSDIETFRHLRRQGKKSASWKIPKGRIASLRYMPIFLIKRRKLAPHKTIDTNYLWHLMHRGY